MDGNNNADLSHLKCILSTYAFVEDHFFDLAYLIAFNNNLSFI